MLRTATTMLLLSALAVPVVAQEQPDADPPETEPEEEKAPADDPETRALELNKAGITAFREGRFEDAAKAFAQASEFSRNEALRKNESIAWFRAEKCEPAVVAGNKFLLLEGVSPEDEVLVSSVIANCKADFARTAIGAGDYDLADSLLTDAEALETDGVAKDRVAAVRVELAEARKKPPAEPEIRTVYVPEPQEKPPYLGYGLMFGGGAVVLATVAYHLVALSWVNRVRAIEQGEAGSRDQFEQRKRGVKVARIAVPTLYAVGGATAATGVVLTFFWPLDEVFAGRGATPILGLGGRF